MMHTNRGRVFATGVKQFPIASRGYAIPDGSLYDFNKLSRISAELLVALGGEFCSHRSLSLRVMMTM